MKAFGLVSINNSVSTELFRKVFICYLLVAIATTAFHMLVEFNSTKESIEKELGAIGASIAPSIAKALWDVHHSQLVAIAEGTQKLPVVSGISVDNEDGVNVIGYSLGQAINQTGAAREANISEGVYQHQIPLYFYYQDSPFLVGQLSLFSNLNIVFQRVKLGFLLILVNSLLKSIALWLLFIGFARYIISKPLADLTGQIENIRSDNLVSTPRVALATSKNNEFSLLKNAFDSMVAEISNNQAQLRDHASNLESKVFERTKDLEDREVKLRAAYEELEAIRQKELEILENKTQFMANISHELLTPLAVLRLQIEAMQEGIVDEESGYEVLQRKLTQVERIIEDLYTISLADIDQLALHCQQLEIELFLQDTIEPYKKIASKNELSIRCEFDFPEYLMVYADWRRLSQVFSNILNNAMKYTDPGGEIKISGKTELDQVVIKIEDSAPGVSDDDMGFLFERLYRVESSRNREAGGAGLGLSICNSIVQAHEGTVTIDHSGLGGLMVTVTLPVFKITEQISGSKK